MPLLYMNFKKSIRKAGRIKWCNQDCSRQYIRTTEIQQDTLMDKEVNNHNSDIFFFSGDTKRRFSNSNVFLFFSSIQLIFMMNLKFFSVLLRQGL